MSDRVINLTEGQTLYDKIVAISGIPFNSEEFDVEEYKSHIVRFVDSNVSDEEFDSYPNDLRDWLIDATIVVKDNRKAKNKKKIPPIEGFPVDDDATSTSLRQRLRDGLPKAKGKRGRKRKEGSVAKERHPRVKKPISENRYAKVAHVMIETPGLNWKQILERVDLDPRKKALEATVKYCAEAFHSVCYELRMAGLLPPDYDTMEPDPVPRRKRITKAEKEAQAAQEQQEREAMLASGGGPVEHLPHEDEDFDEEELDENEDELEDEEE